MMFIICGQENVEKYSRAFITYWKTLLKSHGRPILHYNLPEKYGRNIEDNISIYTNSSQDNISVSDCQPYKPKLASVVENI